MRRQSSVVAPQPPVNPNLQSPDSWINRSVQGSSTSSSASSTLSHGEAKPQPQSQAQPQPQPQYKPQYQPLYQPHYQPQYQPQQQPQEQPRTAAVTDMLANSRIGETLLLIVLVHQVRIFPHCCYNSKGRKKQKTQCNAYNCSITQYKYAKRQYDKQ